MHTEVLKMMLKQGIEDTILVHIEAGQKAYRLRDPQFDISCIDDLRNYENYIYI